MIYLLSNVIFASAFMLTIKWVQVRRREDVLSVGSINYIVAFLLAALSTRGLAADSSIMPAVITGSVMGGCYFTCYFFVI
jgi:hypothetical protein